MHGKKRVFISFILLLIGLNSQALGRGLFQNIFFHEYHQYRYYVHYHKHYYYPHRHHYKQYRYKQKHIENFIVNKDLEKLQEIRNKLNELPITPKPPSW